MIKHLNEKGIGYDFLKKKNTINERTHLKKLQLYFLADHLTKNLGSITLIQGRNLPKCDLLTYSFPCTDISVCGKRKGFSKDGERTRSGLLWEVERILKGMKHLPKILLMENVPAILNKEFLAPFREWLAFLESLGYTNYYKIITSSDYGVPQVRQRCFMISLLGDYSYQFPMPRSKEKIVYLSDLLVSNDNSNLYIDNDFTKKALSVFLSDATIKNRNRIFTINREKGKKLSQWNRIIHSDCLCCTLTTRDSPMIYLPKQKKVRSLSAMECMLLMGFTQQDYYKISKFVSDSQIYKQAGNSIVVPVLEDLFRSLIE